MHSVTCTLHVLHFCVHALCEMHLQNRLAAILQPPVQPPRRDWLRAAAVVQHLLLCDGAVQDVHQPGMPRLNHRQGGWDQRALLEEADWLVPVGVRLAMEMKYSVLRCMMVLLFMIPGPPSRAGQGSPGIHLVHTTMMQHSNSV